MNKILLGLLLFFSVLQAQEKPQVVKEENTKEFSVEDCVAYALKHSPALKKLKIDLSDSKYDTMIARAAFDLGLSLTSRHTEAKDEAGVRDTTSDRQSLTLSQEIPGGFTLSTTGTATLNDIDNTQQGDLSITLSKVLLGGGTIEESLEGIRDGLVDELIALNNVSREKRNIKFRVQRQFYRIIRNVQSLAIQERRLARSKKNLEIAIERDKPLDIATAKIEIPETELNVLAAKRRIETEFDSLKVLMGMPPNNQIKVKEAFDYKPSNIDVEDDLFFAEKNEESFVNNALRREKVERDVRIAKTRSYPDLSLNFTQSYASRGSETANLHGRQQSVVSLNLSFDLGERADRARLAKSNNSLEDNSVDRYILRQNKFQRLRELSRRIKETEKSVVIQGERIKLNERQLELFKDRYDNGEIDILEYIRSENSLEDSRVQLINLKTNYMELLSEYLFEVGK